MGLDINPLPKPKPGHEAEFVAVWTQVQIAEGRMKDAVPERRSLLSRLFSRRPDTGALVARFQEISTPHVQTIGAPVVGKDAAADDWLRRLLEEQGKSEADVARAREQMSGYHALEAMPDCDGFPVYSNAYLYDGTDRASFRGEFLASCLDVIGRDCLDRAWEPMLSGQLAEWGRQLRAAADAYAAANGVEHVLGTRECPPGDETAPDAKAHIVDQAARWASFWSERGHGSEPYY